MDRLLDERIDRSRDVNKRLGGGLIAHDLLVNIALLRWQQRMRKGSVGKGSETAVVSDTKVVSSCLTHHGFVNRGRQLACREKRGGDLRRN